MNIVQLTASPFFGGPERQMLGLAQNLPRADRSTFLSFPERGQCRPFLEEATRRGFQAAPLEHNTPHFAALVREVARRLRDLRADVLCCHGYKSDLVGIVAARRRGIPVVAVSRGWTAATWRVRLYEWLDRRSLPRMDAVVCVSEAQARKVRKTGVAEECLHVIRNAIQPDRFGHGRSSARTFLQSYFPRPQALLVGAAGRLSPEKGFDVLIESAASVLKACPGAGFVLFGDGPLHASMVRRIAQLGLQEHFVLAGFRADLDRWLPGFDVTVLPSYTEGLPNVVLESFAARVPVVATAVGGTPEVIEDGISGYLVPPGQPGILAQRLLELLGDESMRQRMGHCGHQRVCDDFSFAAHARQYHGLFEALAPTHAHGRVFAPAGLPGLPRGLEDSPASVRRF
jgi:glycosyltransferase involved in cell wall biosynthesis